METCLKTAINNGQLRLGLPMWFMDGWKGNLLSQWQQTGTALQEYVQVFSSVEGNTTFYGLPDEARINQWLGQIDKKFRFCFKLPKDISHTEDLNKAWQQQQSRWQSFEQQLGSSLGNVLLQLPAGFGPQRLAEILTFLEQFRDSSSLPVSVELRHHGFFDKGANEQALLRGLADLSVSRTIFDSRGLFHDNSQTFEVLDARQKKPRMPVHPVATNLSPVVRFIGHSDWKQNEQFLLQWQKKLQQWLSEGRTPYFFIHTAGNTDVQYFVRFIEGLWGVEERPWPGENAVGHTENLF